MPQPPKTNPEIRHLLIGGVLLDIGRLRPERETVLAALKELERYAANEKRYQETVEHCARLHEGARRVAG